MNEAQHVHSISARHSFEFRIVAKHVAKKLICVSRGIITLFGGASCGGDGVLQTFARGISSLTLGWRQRRAGGIAQSFS